MHGEILTSRQDVRSCVEQLQVIEKEMRTLDAAQKELADLKDTLDRKKGERAELIMRREVRCARPSQPLYELNPSGIYSVYTSSSQTLTRSLSAPNGTPKTSASRASRLSSGCSASTRRCPSSGATTIARSRSSARRRTRLSARCASYIALLPYVRVGELIRFVVDGGAHEDEPGRDERAARGVLEAQARNW